MPNLILASSSPFRKAILNALGVRFDTVSPDIDETARENELPEPLVRRLAYAKANAVMAQTGSEEETIIIASDQVATLRETILGKPHTVENALAQLKSFQGKQVIFLTSLCLLNTRTGATYEKTDITKVHFRMLPDERLLAYINAEMPLNCAGSFKSEGLGAMLFTAIETTDPNALIGLPTISLCQGLEELGAPLPQAH